MNIFLVDEVPYNQYMMEKDCMFIQILLFFVPIIDPFIRGVLG